MTTLTKTTLTNRLFCSLLLTATATVALADDRLPEPDLVLYGSVAIDGVVIETADPVPENNVIVRAMLGGTVLASYQLGADPDVLDGNGHVQYLLRVPVEFLGNGAAPSGAAAIVGDQLDLVLVPAGSGPLNATTYDLLERGTVEELNLDSASSGCSADLDGSGDIGFSDLVTVLAEWGPCVGCASDLDGDGLTGFSDILVILSGWGPCP